MQRAYHGLSTAEALERLKRVGPNEVAHPGARELGAIVLETLREPMFLLLLGAAGLYLVLGELGEGIFMFVGAMVSTGLVVLQEERSERALSALQDLAQPQARVLRDGDFRLIAARELVPGDIVLVGEGDRIPADALLVGGDVLSVDESMLTGESAPVTKQSAQEGAIFPIDAAPGSEAGSWLFAGTLIAQGHGVAETARTGPHSAIGKIGLALAEIEQEPTPLQKAAGRLTGIIGLFALAFCALVATAYGNSRQDWAGGALAGLTVAIGLIPEEFPMVLAIFMALGAWRLATQKVLVRRSAIIETLGSASMLCVDKTGTLTENRMRVDRLWTESCEQRMPSDAIRDGQLRMLLIAAARASKPQPVDPMDRAVAETLKRYTGVEIASWGEPTQSWPLSQSRLAVVQVWRQTDGAFLAAAKGTPEAIVQLCRLDQASVDIVHRAVERLAQDGVRLLGVAQCNGAGMFAASPEEAPFRFLGLVGFLDPLRKDVVVALREAREAGIGVIMMTGDHPATARAIAKAAGIDIRGETTTGAEVTALPFPKLREILQNARVFARVAPEQKLLIVEALKANGEVVAMTGDGVNDAPALEAAHIGIAMGKRGADVAREAADLVLLDDGFPSIVAGVRLGRRIFANLRKALTYVTAIHVPIAGLALLPIVLGLPQLLYPMHVVMLELAIDPICALAFESEDSDERVMKRPPRRAVEPLFGPRQLLMALAQGAGLLICVLAVYVWAVAAMPETQARGVAFIALVLANLGLALVDASGAGGRILDSRRSVYWAIALGLMLLLALVFLVPGLAEIFRVAAPDAWGVALAVATAFACVALGWLVGRLTQSV